VVDNDQQHFSARGAKPNRRLGTQIEFGKVRKARPICEYDRETLPHFAKNYSPVSLVLRLRSPFYLPETTSYPEILTVKQQAKVGVALAETDLIRSDGNHLFFMYFLSIDFD